MKAKDWKMYVCLIVFSLFMFPGIYAAQEGNGKTACEPVRKTRSETLLVEKRHGNRQVRVLLVRLWDMTDK